MAEKGKARDSKEGMEYISHISWAIGNAAIITILALNYKVLKRIIVNPGRL